MARIDGQDKALSEVTLDDISAHLQAVAGRRLKRTSISHHVAALRAFFHYAHSRGWCREGLAAIDAPRIYRLERPPRGPAWNDVQRLLAACMGDTPSEIRDHAMLLVVAVYGVRSGEVRHLRLEDIDWEREIVRIRRPKQRKSQHYPLMREVGAAILRYLHEVRPKCTLREIFLTRVQPDRTLTGPGFGSMVRNRLQRLGLVLPCYGPHALRHSCATHLLAEGVSLKEIADHLGHVSLTATQMYAKVDLRIARSRRTQPEGTGRVFSAKRVRRYTDPEARQHRSPARRGRDQPGRSPVILSQAVEQYILHKRSLGVGFRSEAVRLRAFVKSIGDCDMRLIEPGPVRQFLEGTGPITPFWLSKYHTLKAFYLYALAREYCVSCPLQLSIPQMPEAFQPYIYTNRDIERLIDAADARHRHVWLLEPHTVRTLLLLLCGTGLRIGEALHLKLEDFDAEAGVLTIRETKFFKSRLVPVGADLNGVLCGYIDRQCPGRRCTEPTPFARQPQGWPRPASESGARLQAPARASRSLALEGGSIPAATA